MGAIPDLRTSSLHIHTSEVPLDACSSYILVECMAESAVLCLLGSGGRACKPHTPGAFIPSGP